MQWPFININSLFIAISFAVKNSVVSWHLLSLSILGDTKIGTDSYDDESAYYSEIGTFRKLKDADEKDIHYASTDVCNRIPHVYHVVENTIHTDYLRPAHGLDSNDNESYHRGNSSHPPIANQ